MLTELRIENLGVIADLDLLLGPGMTALTGETGTGKTMLVEAVSLLVGGRADTAVVRQGAPEATVEGRFVEGGEELVLARVVPRDGRSRAYVNGRLATVGSLSEEGARLVDLHGQHAHQSLLSVVTQRAALDRFGRIDLDPLRAARTRMAELDAALAALGGDTRARARELDLLRYQAGEIAGAHLGDPHEDDALDAEEDRLAGAQAHRDAAETAHAALLDDAGALDAVGIALSAVSGRGPLAELEARLRAMSAELADLGAELRRAGDAIEEDPERLGAVRERRQRLRELRRKYGDSLSDVMAFADQVSARLAELESHDARVGVLEAERAEAQRAEAAAASAVAAARRAAAPRLAEQVEAHLRQLAMARVRVVIDVSGADPADDVTFGLGANPGEPVLPLSKVASGGELARAMLALRLVLTEAPDTLVFDEVDAGIGGEAALAVGRALSTLGHRHQVLVVTHHAQVAAFADVQIAVDKRVVGRRTEASAVAVTSEDRVRELSRMLSGLRDSGSARRHAAELLDAAAAARGR
jgi:DNA repair protein RecN (Recombination protein N)